MMLDPNMVSYQSKMENEWVYAKVKGIPPTMRWPVQILEEKSDGLVEVFCKSDDAILTVKHGDLEIFPSRFWEEIGLSTRKKWSEEEEEELRRYLPDYFNKTTTRTCPSRQECYEAIARSRENGGSLHERSWETIKKKINNDLKKK